MVQSWHWALPQAASQPARVLPGCESVSSHQSAVTPRHTFSCPALAGAKRWVRDSVFVFSVCRVTSLSAAPLHVLDTNENYADKQSLKQLGWLWVLDGLYHFWRLLPQKVNVKIKNTICNVNIYYMILINIKLKPGILNQIILRQLDVSLSLIIMTYTHAVTLYLVFIEL